MKNVAEMLELALMSREFRWRGLILQSHTRLELSSIQTGIVVIAKRSTHVLIRTCIDCKK